MRIVVEVRRDTSANVVLNNLYKYTALQVGVWFSARSYWQRCSKDYDFKEIFDQIFGIPNRSCSSSTEFETQKPKISHIPEGLRKALDLRRDYCHYSWLSRYRRAKAQLIERFEFSPFQAQAIPDMRLARLTGLEREDWSRI